MKPRVKIRLELFLKGQTVYKTTKRKKTQIRLDIKRVLHDKGTIEVEYAPCLTNSATSNCDIELNRIISVFTEKPLLSHVGGEL